MPQSSSVDIDQPGEAGGHPADLALYVRNVVRVLVEHDIGPAWVGVNPISGKGQFIWLIDPVYADASVKSGDVLVVASIDRLARSMVDLRRIVDAVVDKSAQVRFVKESLVFGAGSDPRSDLMLGILGSLAEFERAIIRERQAEGIAAAKKRGVYKGRKPSLSRSQIDQARQLKSEGVAVTEIARRLGVHRSTIYRALAD